MATLSFPIWIANAAAGLFGQYGDVTRQAEQSGCSRQTVYDHTDKVLAAVEAEHSGQPSREELLLENQRLREENAAYAELLENAVHISLESKQEFVVTAVANGLSLTQVYLLLSILLTGASCPSRSTMHRWVQTYSQAAARILVSLDLACRPLVCVACLDEIYFARKPVLVGCGRSVATPNSVFHAAFWYPFFVSGA